MQSPSWYIQLWSTRGIAAAVNGVKRRYRKMRSYLFPLRSTQTNPTPTLYTLNPNLRLPQSTTRARLSPFARAVLHFLTRTCGPSQNPWTSTINTSTVFPYFIWYVLRLENENGNMRIRSAIHPSFALYQERTKSYPGWCHSTYHISCWEVELHLPQLRFRYDARHDARLISRGTAVPLVNMCAYSFSIL